MTTFAAPTISQATEQVLPPVQPLSLQEIYAVCHTPFFGIAATNNSHMTIGAQIYQANPDAYAKATQIQLRRAHKIFKGFLGAKLEYIQPDPKLLDQVYTADPGMFHIKEDGELVAVVANFRYQGYRGGEQSYFHTLAKQLGATIVEMNKYNLHWEGSGDTLPVRDPKTGKITCYLMGCGPRSDEGAAQVLENAWGVPVLPVPLIVAKSAAEQEGFHIDTAVMKPGSEAGHMVVHREVITKEGLKTVQSVSPGKSDALWHNLSDADANAMGTNGVVIGNKVLLHDWKDGIPDAAMMALAKQAGVPLKGFGLSGEYKQWLTDIGCQIKTTDLTSIVLGGGSGKCGSNRITNAVSPAALAQWHKNRRMRTA